MPRYPQTAVTAKRGANHVRATVEDAGSLFIKIEQKNDLGIDALIELIRDAWFASVFLRLTWLCWFIQSARKGLT
jgi:hypothetical protein